MRYTKPEILQTSKAVSTIQGHPKANKLAADANMGGTVERPSTTIAGYAADE